MKRPDEAPLRYIEPPRKPAGVRKAVAIVRVPNVDTTSIVNRRSESPTGELIDAAMEDFTSAGLRVDRSLVSRFVSSLLTKRFVILTGLSGSGKTKLAQAFAAWITPLSVETNEWIELGAELPADRVTYRVDAVDKLSAQFSNDRGNGQRTKVTLPRELIEEWVACIKENEFTRRVPARTIRELVSAETTYSTQLNSFETHLKASAFAIIERQLDPEGNSGYEVVAVGSDWNSNEHILGFADALHPERYARTQSLDLILRAADHHDIPYFLILDEMNLSHVERYFADVLSSIESGESIQLYTESEDRRYLLRDGVPRTVNFPPNLFTVGTVNVDETTYMFSPKVLDRANTIEFRVDDAQLGAFLASPARVDISKLRGKGAQFAKTFLRAAQDTTMESDSALQMRVNSELLLFYNVLAEHGYEFRYRTAIEVSRFILHHRQLNPMEWFLEDAIDAQIYQKLLPKLNGSRARLEPVLRSLAVLCIAKRKWVYGHNQLPELENRKLLISQAEAAAVSTLYPAFGDSIGDDISASKPIYPMSEAKIQRMLRLVRQNGFTSFAEA